MDVVRTLQAFHQGTVSSARALRAVVSHPAWHVPLDDRGSPDLLEDEDGARWFVAHAAPPEGPHVRLDGRALVRGVPHEADGVLLEPDTEHPVSFHRARLPALFEWADAVDLSEALAKPGPGQAERLRSASWRVVARADGRPIVHRFSDLRLVPLFTADDTAEQWLATEPLLAKELEIVAVAGPELFEALAARDDHDGLVFDPSSFSKVPPVGPHFAREILAGVDPRPGGGILPARTVAEIHLWLDLAGARREGRKHTVVQRADGLCALYEAHWPDGVRRIAFALTEPRPDPEDLGEGATRILCAGKLVDAVRARLGGFPDDPTALRPDERPHAALAARWLWELEKLLDGDRLPRSSLRTPEGARSFRERPECTTRAWVTAQRRRAEALAGTV